MKYFVLIFILFSVLLFAENKDVLDIKKKVLNIESIISKNLKNNDIYIEKENDRDKVFYAGGIKFKEIFYNDDGSLYEIKFYYDDMKIKKVNYNKVNYEDLFKSKEIKKLISDKNSIISKEFEKITSNDSGLISSEIFFYNNKEIKINYFLNNKTATTELFYKYGKKIYEIDRNNNGTINSITTYDKNEKITKKVNYDNGKLESEEFYKDTKKHGKSYIYKKSGEKLLIGNYIKI